MIKRFLMETIGEKLFEEYLNSREIKYEFERRLPGHELHWRPRHPRAAHEPRV